MKWNKVQSPDEGWKKVIINHHKVGLKNWKVGPLVKLSYIL